jgi:hypothetical protein
MTAHDDIWASTGAVVRKPPKNEPAWGNVCRTASFELSRTLRNVRFQRRAASMGGPFMTRFSLLINYATSFSIFANGLSVSQDVTVLTS